MACDPARQKIEYILKGFVTKISSLDTGNVATLGEAFRFCVYIGPVYIVKQVQVRFSVKVVSVNLVLCVQKMSIFPYNSSY